MRGVREVVAAAAPAQEFAWPTTGSGFGVMDQRALNLGGAVLTVAANSTPSYSYTASNVLNR